MVCARAVVKVKRVEIFDAALTDEQKTALYSAFMEGEGVMLDSLMYEGVNVFQDVLKMNQPGGS